MILWVLYCYNYRPTTIIINIHHRFTCVILCSVLGYIVIPIVMVLVHVQQSQFLADRTEYGRAYATVLRPSSLSSVVCL